MTVGMKNELALREAIGEGVQRPEDTLRLRSGSCRDFAVLMMEAAVHSVCGALVSGYIFVPEATRTPRSAAARPTHGCRCICRGRLG
jgi:hypothetical protein